MENIKRIFRVNYETYNINGSQFSPLWLKQKGLYFISEEKAQAYADTKNNDQKDLYTRGYVVEPIETCDHLIT